MSRIYFFIFGVRKILKKLLTVPLSGVKIHKLSQKTRQQKAKRKQGKSRLQPR